MASLDKRLDELGGTIQALMKIGGTAGLSLGILRPSRSTEAKPLANAGAKAEAGTRPGTATAAATTTTTIFKNYGHSDVAAGKTPSEKTLYAGCSLTKALTAACVAILVEEGKVRWEDTVETALPGLGEMAMGHEKKLRVLDLLSHRVGMVRGDNLYTGAGNEYRVCGGEGMRRYLRSRPVYLEELAEDVRAPDDPEEGNGNGTGNGKEKGKGKGRKDGEGEGEGVGTNGQKEMAGGGGGRGGGGGGGDTRKTRVQEPGEKFLYNNDGYEIAGLVVSRHSGLPFGDFVRARLLEPLGLGLERTLVQWTDVDIDDVAGRPGRDVTRCYNVLGGTAAEPLAEATEIPRVSAGRDEFAAASAGMWSCAHDLLKLYAEFVRCFNDQEEVGGNSNGGAAAKTWTRGSTLKQVRMSLMAEIAVVEDDEGGAEGEGIEGKTFYGLGWARTRLPSRLGCVGMNSGVERPVIGKGAYGRGKREGPVVIYHAGALCGSLASALLLPELETVVVVLTNTLALTDVADWVAQLVLQEVLGLGDEGDEAKVGGNEFLEYARKGASGTRAFHERVGREIEDGVRFGRGQVERLNGADDGLGDMRRYAGRYRDGSGLWSMVVDIEKDEDAGDGGEGGEGKERRLCITFDFCGANKPTFPLKFSHLGHHHLRRMSGKHDSDHGKDYHWMWLDEKDRDSIDGNDGKIKTFTWHKDRDELAREGNWVDQEICFFMVEFHFDEREEAESGQAVGTKQEKQAEPDVAPVKIVWYWSNDCLAGPIQMLRCDE
ncbi:hypothetical protein MKZ38_007919 [Zalerion maritima]|uniref:Beta-lactamase-related domain-containing protein n=1 Tax=Zalerion maritima TaxID=339359 RepID=A0AAD5RHP0_9PEZI|nr:hypothetical protein MKZ38_007919 [Zalerion maritima]